VRLGALEVLDVDRGFLRLSGEAALDPCCRRGRKVLSRKRSL
jgi:hypothetical protein